MVLLLAMMSAAAAVPPPVKAEARVSIVILQPHRASAKNWDPAAKPNQREVIKKEREGSELRLRLTEFE